VRHPGVLIGLGVFVLAVVAHAPGLRGGFVYDDHRFVEQNHALDHLTPERFFRDPATASATSGIQTDIYRPVRTLDYAVGTAVFGRDASWPFHLGNILLHALGALLLFRLLVPLVRGRRGIAAAAAALYAVHPVTVESVAWISSRGDLLALDGMLAALIVLERKGLGRTLLGGLLAAFAVFAKESALVLPALLVLRDLALPDTRGRPGVRTRLLRTLLLVAVAGVYLAVRLQVISGLAQVPEFIGGSRSAAARGMLAGLVWYAHAIVWPTGFPFDVQLAVPARWLDPAVVLGMGLLLTTVAVSVWGLARRERRLVAFGALGALACLVPVSNVIVPLKVLVAERFLLPSLVCVAAGVAWTLGRLAPKGRRIAFFACGILVLVLVPTTWRRTAAWASDTTLWEAVLHENPSAMRAYEGLGYEYLRKGRIRDAEMAYRSYLEFNPADGKAMVMLADLFGGVADTLRFEHPVPDEVLSGGGRRRARVAQLGLYRNAIDTWRRIGLVRGRGSIELLRHVHEQRIRAAVDLGDLREAKAANDDLLRLDGVDPADVEGVLARAKRVRRVVRLNLALTALTVRVPPGLDHDLYARRMAERALVLRDVGIDPRLPDPAARKRLLPRYRAIVEEEGGGRAEAVNLARLLDALGRRKEAQQVRGGGAKGARSPGGHR